MKKLFTLLLMLALSISSYAYSITVIYSPTIPYCPVNIAQSGSGITLMYPPQYSTTLTPNPAWPNGETVNFTIVGGQTYSGYTIPTCNGSTTITVTKAFSLLDCNGITVYVDVIVSPSCDVTFNVYP